MSKSIVELVDELPTGGLTVSMLKALDFAAPGEWENTVGFVNTIKSVTGEDDEDLIPGDNPAGKLAFMSESFDSVKGWMSGLVSANDLTPQKVVHNLQGFVDIADDKLDYLAAFLDVATNYYEHTGTQTLAHRLIERAVAEI